MRAGLAWAFETKLHPLRNAGTQRLFIRLRWNNSDLDTWARKSQQKNNHLRLSEQVRCKMKDREASEGGQAGRRTYGQTEDYILIIATTTKSRKRKSDKAASRRESVCLCIHITLTDDGHKMTTLSSCTTAILHTLSPPSQPSVPSSMHCWCLTIHTMHWENTHTQTNNKYTANQTARHRIMVTHKRSYKHVDTKTGDEDMNDYRKSKERDDGDGVTEIEKEWWCSQEVSKEGGDFWTWIIKSVRLAGCLLGSPL